MKEPNLLFNYNDLQKHFSFYYLDEKHNTRTYYCLCGHEEVKNVTEVVARIDDPYNFKLEDLEQNSRNIHTCPSCKRDYTKAENYMKLFDLNTLFMEQYDFEENDKELILYKSFFFAAPELYDNLFVEEITKGIKISHEFKYFRIDKATKKLFYKDKNNLEEQEFNLDGVFKLVSAFFLNETKNGITDNLIAVHYFLNRLSDQVSDVNNMDIITELMSQMIGSHGLDVFTKITSIFFGIICYPNLSTIALTKGLVFLYDMLNSCRLPNPQALIDEKVTSPLKIFNYLINIKNDEIIKELEDDDSNKDSDYVYISINDRQVKIKKFDNSSDAESRVSLKKGVINVEEIIGEKRVSPYIFNSIKKFSDYDKLIRYTKFIKFEELIELVMKYDSRLIINMWRIISHRDKSTTDIERIKQFLELGKSYSIRQMQLNLSLKLNAKKSFNKLIGSDDLTYEDAYDNIENAVNIEVDESLINENEIDYAPTEYFDLDIYDDCVNMIINLKWDPKKELHKIRKISKLIDYHNQLSNHYSMIKNEEKNKKFIEFTTKFKYLEEYNKDGLRIEVIRNPENLLKQAKKFKNCSASYLPRINDEKYVMLIIHDGQAKAKKSDLPEYMVGLRYERGGLEFDAAKGYCNQIPEKHFRKAIREFMSDRDISFKDLPDIRLDDARKDFQDKVVSPLNRDELLDMM